MRERLHRIRARMKRRRQSASPQGGPIRLHLGCGSDYWDGYINIDAGTDTVCDVQLDFRRLADVYTDGSVAEIAMMHSLSYLRLWEARNFLADVYRLLTPGGRFVAEFPDLVKCARRAIETDGAVLDEYLEAVRGLYAFDMGQIKRQELFTPYAFGWSAAHLRVELEHVGFSEVHQSDPQTHGQRTWRDTRVEATKSL